VICLSVHYLKTADSMSFLCSVAFIYNITHVVLNQSATTLTVEPVNYNTDQTLETNHCLMTAPNRHDLARARSLTHRNNYTTFIGSHIGAHGYPRLNTAQGAYTRSWIMGISLTFNSFSSSLFPICRDLGSPDSQSINPFSINP
jgi:hypothetical protein